MKRLFTANGKHFESKAEAKAYGRPVSIGPDHRLYDERRKIKSHVGSRGHKLGQSVR